MAVTLVQLTLLSPGRAHLLLGNDGAGAFTITNAMLLAAYSAAGPPAVTTPGFADGTPLGDLVRTPVVNSAAALAAMMGEKGRIYFSSQIAVAGGLSVPPSVVPTEAAGLITLVCTVPATVGAWDFYIEAVPSQVR